MVPQKDEDYTPIDSQDDTLLSDVRTAMEWSCESGTGYKLVNPFTGVTYGYVYQKMVSAPLMQRLVRQHQVEPPEGLAAYLPSGFIDDHYVPAGGEEYCPVDPSAPRQVDYPQFHEVRYPTFQEVSMVISPIERSALEMKIRQVFGAGVGTTALLAIIDAVNGGPPAEEPTPDSPPVEAEVDEPHPVLERDVVIQEATP